ncbi:MAG: MarR family transcriptional regulator [Nocardioides sp.]|nr:MarR family transcriptional regulator [Nocardioides sp.]
MTDQDYARLLTVRSGLRRFERWSAEQAAAHGVTPSQHQLLLAVRGHAGADPEAGLTISQAADYLLIRHHSAVELIDRCERAGLVERSRDRDDHRVVRLRLSAAGEQLLADLSEAHLEELSRLTPLFESMLDALGAPTDR